MLIYSKVLSWQSTKKINLASFMALNMYKSSWFWNCRLFPSPTLWRKKGGNFKPMKLFNWLTSFLYWLCFSCSYFLKLLLNTTKTWNDEKKTKEYLLDTGHSLRPRQFFISSSWVHHLGQTLSNLIPEKWEIDHEIFSYHIWKD